MIGTILGVIVVIAGVIYAAARVESKGEFHALQADKDLKANELVHSELKGYIKEVDGECEGLGGDMIEIKTEIKYIRKDMKFRKTLFNMPVLEL